ncbi:probable aminotransferase TAT2 [Momordica charantia]|uniref:Probable aminotransferase TAT2 n=1 Tax=Momordica charantia TaxID=3673 RepID=A0A6J1D8B8_MOMCH|nr:probable aminotransferase TAT2 [Momordica charantia]XP_022149562.1 probable aminotransferase TAT2 [Momordica charantia]XP_022149563.1 probable aminotransferase TAT2 [Momordica charantia]
MEKGSRKWRFESNSDLFKPPGISANVVSTRLMQSLNDEDKRVVIPLGHGDTSSVPCYRTAAAAEDAIVNAVRSDEFKRYSPTLGIPEARRAVADHLSRDLPFSVAADDVYLTSGCIQGIQTILTVLSSSPGANILLPRPGFPVYELRAAFAHLETRHFDLIPQKDWEVDLDAIEALADEKTVALVVVNPGNPCGSVYTREHLQKIAETARKLGVLVISDEVYANLTFGCNPFVPMGAFSSIAPVITLGSISKRCVVPGWRFGWLVANDPHGILHHSGIVERIKNYISFAMVPATIIQAAIPQILETTKEDFFSSINNLLREAADTFCEGLKEIPCISCTNKPEGSMFMMVKLDPSLLEGIEDDIEFCVQLAREESVIILPGAVFGLKNWLRISFALDIATLEDGLRRLKAFCQRHVRSSKA